ncbi:hypothetical protein BGW36DRAFT_353715 [Talaromyces proteolyticus]|uniref:Uncharacterized protein n=1 Tax=Talaromyces proteolyticus TaxID=1131652 RepID=A0AAD4L3M7_9EURO|nr:uncharacterized protein BGW36DRAFT_353715 [Talaromyces proteolyticus]KAH8705308.1 hypothetical protein BGW36DRAFT_353715 [Talaromyces proteolyticus]
MGTPADYEVCLSILSTPGLILAVVGIWFVLITRITLLSLAPIVVSIANGLCYYAYYTEYPTSKRTRYEYAGGYIPVSDKTRQHPCKKIPFFSIPLGVTSAFSFRASSGP